MQRFIHTLHVENEQICAIEAVSAHERAQRFAGLADAHVERGVAVGDPVAGPAVRAGEGVPAPAQAPSVRWKNASTLSHASSLAASRYRSGVGKF